MGFTLTQLNAASQDEAERMLHGLYEHSPWIAAAALRTRPFASLAALEAALAGVLAQADARRQLALIRAHPELAGKAAETGTLTAESTSEQSLVGLNACTPDELARIRALNRRYGDQFHFPFILCVRGASGKGLTKQEILDTFARRVERTHAEERAEALAQINQIAALRLRDRFAA